MGQGDAGGLRGLHWSQGEGLDDYGSRKTSWPPMRRHRTAGSPAGSTHSKVARPSGPEKDHVISQMPGAPCTGLTHKAVGQPVR